jgi:hypothetical protein
VRSCSARAEQATGADDPPSRLFSTSWASSRVGRRSPLALAVIRGKPGGPNHLWRLALAGIKMIVRSKNRVPVRLPEERWRHITQRHPEMANQREQVLETLTAPEQIQEGDSGELLAIRYYSHTPLSSKYLVTVYRELSAEDGFILTAYLTNRPSATRVTLWKR